MRFGPGHVPFEPKQNGGKSCCFEWLKDHKVESQRLKKSKKYAFRDSPFTCTRQHNVLLNGTKSNILDGVCRKYFIDNLTCKACQCDANITCNCKRHSVKEAFSKGNVILMIF